jgi:arylsulfatase
MRPGVRPSPLEGRTKFAYYPGDTRYAGGTFPSTGRGWTITAQVGVDGGAAQGPILVQGDHFGGQGLVLDQGRPTYIYNPGDMDHVYRVQAPEALGPGQHEIVVAFGPGTGPGDVVDLMVDGKSVAQMRTPGPVRGRGAAYVGRSGIAPLVDGVYAPVIPASCGCTIAKVTIEKH